MRHPHAVDRRPETAAYPDLLLGVLDRVIAVRCEHAPTRALLDVAWGALVVAEGGPDVRYRITRRADLFCIRRDDILVGEVTDAGRLLHLLDSDMVVRLQTLRRDLLFVRGSVVVDGRGAHVLTGPSGAGKSTTCWGLVHRGFGYLSDELAPIRPSDLAVLPFPRALCTKAEPPAGFPLPRGTAATSRGFHVPVGRLPSRTVAAPRPLRSLLFVDYRQGRPAPVVRPVSSAETATRLYPNVLNAPGHDDAAMRAVARASAAVRGFVVEAAELSATADEIGRVLRAVPDGAGTRGEDGPDLRAR